MVLKPHFPWLNLPPSNATLGLILRIREGTMKIGVIIFPGSNCDHDAYWAFKEVCEQPATLLWHDSHDLENSDLIVVPGGFAYGDYLRTGAIARFSPIMQSVKRFAETGGLVLGICNGFQILCEAKLLPGVLLRNKKLKYVCKPVHVRVESTANPFTQALTPGEVLEIPIGHGEGNYYCDEPTLEQLHRQEQVVFRYATPQGEITEAANPNGSLENIAGICSEGRNVLGMMPHPERASEDVLGMKDGLKLMRSLLGSASLPQ